MPEHIGRIKQRPASLMKWVFLLGANKFKLANMLFVCIVMQLEFDGVMEVME